MSRVFRNLTVVAAIAFIALSSVLYKCHSDKTAWEKVQAELVRMHSGLEFESVIALRSQIANTDTALKMYTTDWRVYPPGKEERVRSGEKSLSYINSALDWQTSEPRVLDQTHVHELDKYPEVTVYVPRICADGQVQIISADAISAFTIVGMSFLENAEYPMVSNARGSTRPRLPALDFEKETDECQQEEKSRRESADKKYWAQFRYRISLAVLASAKGTCVFEVKADGIWAGEYEMSPGHRKDFGVNQDLMIFRTDCYDNAQASDVIRTTVNGRPYAAQWTAHVGIIAPN